MYFEKASKDNLQFISSLFVLFAGLVLVFISLFIKPTGEIHPSVITAFGMFLSFVGAVWHLDLKYDFKTKELEHHISSKMKMRDKSEQAEQEQAEQEQAEQEQDKQEQAEEN